MANATWDSGTYTWADARVTWDGVVAEAEGRGGGIEGLLVRNKRLWLGDPGLPGEPWHGHDDYTLLGPDVRV